MNIIFQQDQPIKSINKRDVEIIQGLKEHLMVNFLEDHTLEELSKNFGTNTTKLMMLFKKNFGKSIFEFISELKMNYAHKLLLDDYQVIEVSRIVGYKNAHHFSTAFKKRFSICPSQLSKLKMAG
jgi:AraC-type DNA-binding domain-containing proteins